METRVVDIFELSFDGAKGVGKLPEGKVIFVPRTSPGDQVRVKITQNKKSFCQGEVLEIIKASPYRVKPKCEIYEECGGCQLQHVAYPTQISEKHNILKRYIDRSAPSAQLMEFVPSDEIWNYRNRLEVHFENSKWGFYKRKSHQLVTTQECHIAKRSLNETLNKIEVSTGHIHVAEKNNDLETSMNDDLQFQTSEGIVQISYGRKRGLEGLFAQVNEGVNQKLKAQVMQHTDALCWDLALDFYAGSGNFTAQIAQSFPQKKVHSIELSESLVAEGQRNLRHLSNISWYQMPCEKYSFIDDKSMPTLALLDPPRLGCDKMFLENLLNQDQIQSIIYISCNPPMLFRDLQILRQKFQLESLQGFDMFPQTMHFEAVAVLKRLN